MKKIEAIFKEEHLDAVKDALVAAGFNGMTVMPVKGRGQGGGIQLEWRAGSYRVDFLHKYLLMIVVADEAVETVIRLIAGVCDTQGQPGAGKIIVLPVDQVIHLRDGTRET